MCMQCQVVSHHPPHGNVIVQYRLLIHFCTKTTRDRLRDVLVDAAPNLGTIAAKKASRVLLGITVVHPRPIPPPSLSLLVLLRAKDTFPSYHLQPARPRNNTIRRPGFGISTSVKSISNPTQPMAWHRGAACSSHLIPGLSKSKARQASRPVALVTDHV